MTGRDGWSRRLTTLDIGGLRSPKTAKQISAEQVRQLAATGLDKKQIANRLVPEVGLTEGRIYNRIVGSYSLLESFKAGQREYQG